MATDPQAAAQEDQKAQEAQALMNLVKMVFQI